MQPRQALSLTDDASLSSLTLHPTPTGDAVAPVDLEHLARYTGGNASLDREILDLFCGQAGDLFAQLRQAETLPEWRFATHSLKGSARAVGAWAVAELAATAELCEPHSDAAVDLVDQLCLEIERARSFIAKTYSTVLKEPA